MNSSYELLKKLKSLGYLQEHKPKYWWPNHATQEVVISAILTQQTKWIKVEKALENLDNADMNTLEKIASCDLKELAILIKPSGFYNTKAKRLQLLASNIIKEFGDFENFKESVSREWLISQKGLGFESVDAILCYGCQREVFVVDSYTHRLLSAIGYEMEDYHEIQEWFVSGIESNWSNIETLYEKEVDLFTVFARFHGKIVEYMKDHAKGKKVNIENLKD